MSGRARAAEPGWLITLEGVEGAGKSTQAGALGRWLEARGWRVVTTSEPDGTPLGVVDGRIENGRYTFQGLNLFGLV